MADCPPCPTRKLYTMDEKYQIKTPVFEGPLDMLLSLVEKRKLFISDISLAQVADDYMAYVKNLDNFPIADSAHFILIASTLVLIKSKSLLPNLSLSEEEQQSIDDLETRLSEYKKYKTLSEHLRQRFGIYISYLPSRQWRHAPIFFSPGNQTTISKIYEIIKLVIADMPKTEVVSKAVVEKVISLEEMIENLTRRITANLKMSFKDFSGLSGKIGIKQNKLAVIVSFLAMLELVKQGIIQVRQDRGFQDIEMETQQMGVPSY